MTFARTRLEEDLAKAEAAVAELRAKNAEIAEAFRADPTDDGKELLKRGAASLAALRDRVDAAKAALTVFDKHGTPHGLVTHDGRVIGSIAVLVKPGSTRADREDAIEAVLSEELVAAAKELGATLGASPVAYTRELPGRDEEGRTLLEVGGRVEGDVLLPAVSRAAKRS